MINNGWAQVELYRPKNALLETTNMHNIPSNISSIDVRRFFVERTSIIREPIEGRIDFTHRTFQDFLAAKAALNEGDSGVLIKERQSFSVAGRSSFLLLV